MSMESRWEDNDKRKKNWYLVINLSRNHFAPHNFYVGQPGIESGPPRQDCDRGQPKYSAETLPHAVSPTHCSHGPARDGIRGFEVKGRWLAAWPTARSSDLQKYESRPTFLSSTSRYPKQNCLVWSFPGFTPLVLLTTAVLIRRVPEHWMNDLAGETRGSTLWEETRQCQFVHQKPYTDLTGIELGALATRNRRITAWAMVQALKHLFVETRVPPHRKPTTSAVQTPKCQCYHWH
jgi:hypothetical protein